MNLPTPNYNKSDKYLWADYFELLCLQNSDSYLSKAEMEDRVELYMEDIMPDLEEENAEDELIKDDLTEDEDRDIFSGDLVSIFEYRQYAYAEYYPFKISGNRIEKKSELSDEHLFYIYLLMSSHLKFFKKEMSVLTGDFEHFSVQGLRSYFGANVILDIFGKNSVASSTIFTGSEFQKFEKLAEFFGERMQVDESGFNKHSSGDGGTDIVGCINFADNKSSKVLIAGQCKCKVDWSDSRHSSSASSLEGYLSMTHPNLNFSFIPYCFRRTDGEWVFSASVSKVILVDRQRLLSLIAGKTEKFKKSGSYVIVQNFLKQHEDLV